MLFIGKVSHFLVSILFLLLSEVGSASNAQPVGGEELPISAINIPNLATSFTEFEQTIHFFQNRPGSAKLKKIVLLGGQRLVVNLLARYHAIQLDASSASVVEIAAINRLIADLALKQELLTQLNGHFFHLADPRGPMSIDNIKEGSGPGQEQLDQANRGPLLLTDQTWNRYLNPAKDFTVQYTYFMIATGLISIAKYAAMEEENPGVLEEYLHHVNNPLAMLSFAAFMATSHPVTQMLHGIDSRALPRSFIPHLGMAAGLVASSLFYELFTDQQLHQCIESLFQDEENCALAFSKWVYTQKVMQLTPAIMSLTLSVVSAGVLTDAVSWGVAHYGPPLAARFPRLQVLRNLGTKTMEQLSESAAPLRTAPIAIGGFLVFLAFDQLYSPVINKWWLTSQIKRWDMKAWMDLHVYGHPSYWRNGDRDAKTGKFPIWYIDDVFDVEVTNLPSAQGYLAQLGDAWEQSQGPPIDYLSCQQQGLAEGDDQKQLVKIDGFMQVRTAAEMDKIQRYERSCQQAQEESDLFGLDVCDLVKDLKANPPIFHKSATQRSCEVLAKGPELVLKHGEIHTLWRQHLLYDFNLALAKWTTFLANFTVSYATTYKVYDLVTNLKFQASKTNREKGGEPPPNFMDNAKEFRLRYQQVYGKLFHQPMGSSTEKTLQWGMNDIFHHLTNPADRALYFMACGPDLIGPQSTWRNFWYANAYSLVSVKGGMEIKFLPPALMARDEKICRDLEIEALKRNVDKDEEVFFYHTPLIDQNGKKYPNLLSYVYENLDPSVWKRARASARGSNFPGWWTEKVLPEVSRSWQRYQDLFSKMLEKHYWPQIFASDRDLERSQEIGNFQLEKYFSVMLKQLHDYRRFLSRLQTIASLTATTIPEAQNGDVGAMIDLTGKQLDRFIAIISNINQQGPAMLASFHKHDSELLKQIVKRAINEINQVLFLTTMKKVDEFFAKKEATQEIHENAVEDSAAAIIKSFLTVAAKMQSEAALYFRYIFQLDLEGDMLEKIPQNTPKEPVSNPFRSAN